jgi:hypothetical protein
VELQRGRVAAGRPAVRRAAAQRDGVAVVVVKLEPHGRVPSGQGVHVEDVHALGLAGEHAGGGVIAQALKVKVKVCNCLFKCHSSFYKTFTCHVFCIQLIDVQPKST